MKPKNLVFFIAGILLWSAGGLLTTTTAWADQAQQTKQDSKPMLPDSDMKQEATPPNCVALTSECSACSDGTKKYSDKTDHKLSDYECATSPRLSQGGPKP